MGGDDEGGEVHDEGDVYVGPWGGDLDVRGEGAEDDSPLECSYEDEQGRVEHEAA